MHAVMGPAIRVPRSSGFVSTQRTASIEVEPNGKPSARWFVVENDGVAKGICEWALTAAVSETGESGATIGGSRTAGEVVNGRAA